MFFDGYLVVSRKTSHQTENKKSERRRPIFYFTNSFEIVFEQAVPIRCKSKT